MEHFEERMYAKIKSFLATFGMADPFVFRHVRSPFLKAREKTVSRKVDRLAVAGSFMHRRQNGWKDKEKTRERRAPSQKARDQLRHRIRHAVERCPLARLHRSAQGKAWWIPPRGSSSKVVHWGAPLKPHLLHMSTGQPRHPTTASRKTRLTTEERTQRWTTKHLRRSQMIPL